LAFVLFAFIPAVVIASIVIPCVIISSLLIARRVTVMHQGEVFAEGSMEEIERHEGRMRYLQAHTAMSTLSVTVHEPFPVVGTAGKSVMGEAFTQAWRNFVVLLAFVVQSLGVVLPMAVVAIAGWMVTKRVRLAKQRPA